MFWPLLSFLAIFLTSPSPARIPSAKPTSTRLVTVAWEDPPTYDARAERELFDLANRARAQSELAPFHFDEGLTRAAREHAIVMATRGELSHQFPGEPELSQRLAANCSLYLVEAAENVASADSADQAHDGLMHSVHHRENLLHPSYNVAGFGVVRRGGTLYVVQDFGDSVPQVSTHETETAIAEVVDRQRKGTRLTGLEHLDASAARKEACAMAGQDSLKIAASPQTLQGTHIVRYTSTQPVSLPSTAIQSIEDEKVKRFAVGSCFARSKSYPNGIYWVVLVFY
jgi:uncharacterized protein YkwD